VRPRRDPVAPLAVGDADEKPVTVADFLCLQGEVLK
jgi:hypothetical protein